MTPQDFVRKWKNAELKERSAAQEHFLDLCNILGIDTPGAADPKGEWYTFEKGALKTTGTKGFADVWKRGFSAGNTKAPAAICRKPMRNSNATRRPSKIRPFSSFQTCETSTFTPTGPTRSMNASSLRSTICSMVRSARSYVGPSQTQSN